MPKKSNHDNVSSFRMLWVNLTFTTEPLWFRIVVIILMLFGLLAAIYLLKQWVSVLLVSNCIGDIKKSMTIFIQTLKSK